MYLIFVLSIILSNLVSHNTYSICSFGCNEFGTSMETPSASSSSTGEPSSSSGQSAGADAREVRTTGRAFRGLMSASSSSSSSGGGAKMASSSQQSRKPRTTATTPPVGGINRSSMTHVDASHLPLAHVGFFNDYPDDFNMNEMK
jgi:hypothetical protein